MSETSAAELHVRPSEPLENDGERVQRSDPEALARIVAYGITRRMIFEYLVARDGGLEVSGDAGY